MENKLIGKVLRDEKDVEYVVLNELVYKNITCVYAMMVDDKENKSFFQVNDEKLVNIQSKKMLDALSVELFEGQKTSDTPRKIGENESIEQFLAYLDDFYKNKVNAMI